jgi:hypothetical protein
MTVAIVISGPSYPDVLAGRYMKATFEGDNARNEAIGYIDAMFSAGFWIEGKTVYSASCDGESLFHSNERL